MEGKIFGLPLVLVLLVVLMGIITALELGVVVKHEDTKFSALNAKLTPVFVTMTPSPSATPEATLTATPTAAVKSLLKKGAVK